MSVGYRFSWVSAVSIRLPPLATSLPPAPRTRIAKTVCSATGVAASERVDPVAVMESLPAMNSVMTATEATPMTALIAEQLAAEMESCESAWKHATGATT